MAGTSSISSGQNHEQELTKEDFNENTVQYIRQRPGALPRNKKFRGFLSLWEAAKQGQVLNKIPRGVGIVAQAQAVQQSVRSLLPLCGFIVSSTCGSKPTDVRSDD